MNLAHVAPGAAQVAALDCSGLSPCICQLICIDALSGPLASFATPTDSDTASLQGGVRFNGQIPRMAAQKKDDSEGKGKATSAEGFYNTRRKGPAVQTVLTQSDGAGAGRASSQRPASGKRQKTTPVKVLPAATMHNLAASMGLSPVLRTLIALSMHTGTGNWGNELVWKHIMIISTGQLP